MKINRVKIGCPAADVYSWRIYASPETWCEKREFRKKHLKYVKVENPIKFEKQFAAPEAELYKKDLSEDLVKLLRKARKRQFDSTFNAGYYTRVLTTNGIDHSNKSYKPILRKLGLKSHEIKYVLTKKEKI